MTEPTGKTDFLGNDLHVGDSVVFIAPGYRQLVLGRIVRNTPKTIAVAYENNWNYPKNKPMALELLQRAEQVVKLSGPEMTMYLLRAA